MADHLRVGDVVQASENKPSIGPIPCAAYGEVVAFVHHQAGLLNMTIHVLWSNGRVVEIWRDEVTLVEPPPRAPAALERWLVS